MYQRLYKPPSHNSTTVRTTEPLGSTVTHPLKWEEKGHMSSQEGTLEDVLSEAAEEARCTVSQPIMDRFY